MGKRGPKPNTTQMSILSTRIRTDLKEAVEQSAKVNGRTVSNEICRRLDQSFSDGERVTTTP